MSQKVYKQIDDNMLHDFLMDKVFTPENAAAAAGAKPEKPYMYKKGDRVAFANPRWKNQKGWQDEHEILGFYKDGEVVDENTADPNNTGYGIRLKNLKTGQELNSPASYLKLFK